MAAPSLTEHSGLLSQACLLLSASLPFLPTTNILKNKLGDIKMDIKELGDIQTEIFINLRQVRLLKHYMESRNHEKKNQ